MDVLLIDADSKIPNIALMKLSTWHKSKGDNVELVRVELPYYPGSKKKVFGVQHELFCNTADKVYCSVVFDGHKDFIVGENIIFGGTGVDLTTVLPDDVEERELDYSVYPDNNVSYGFITRGCVRNCSFCVVPKKEGWIHQVNKPEDIIKHKKVKFLDNNILAFPGHTPILKKIISLGVKCDFNQGLDIRLINKANSKLLSKLNYWGEYTFAFDNWNIKEIIKRKLKILNWRKKYEIRFFVYVHPAMEIAETVHRIEWLKKYRCLPYIMRDISCWDSQYNSFFVDLAAYCNQPGIFKKMNFKEFMERRHTNKNRIYRNTKLYYNC